MKTKIVISAGGSGGHLFPALSLAHTLRQQQPDSEVLFVGGGLSVNRYFDPIYPYQDIACGHFSSRSPWALATAMKHITQGVGQSVGYLKRVKPDIVVGFGSYHGFPPLVAATLLRLPTVLFAADTLPGKVVSWMARWATVTTVQFEAAKAYLKGHVVPVQPLLRPQVLAGRMSAQEARLRYGLDPQVRTLLVFGGSQGARAINELMVSCLPSLTTALTEPLQVIHLAGSEEAVSPLVEAYGRVGIRAVVKSFESEMGQAWSAADLALCRSGAGTIAEAQVFHVPLLMIPYPFAAQGHQEKNADAVVSLGAGLKYMQSTLTASALSTTLAQLLNDPSGALMRMRLTWKKQEQQNPNPTLAEIVWETLHGVMR
jgi:UDP-N-acetylglucosamine--N-acetylmuramyl-(pentapeptide) pyrophosphoryl-undecaprenol N-acetylglucosamine transferase